VEICRPTKLAEAPMKPRIIVLSGASNFQELPVDGGPISIGRDASNALCLPDPAVAQKHCRIDPCHRGFELIDLGSENGTFINGIPVRRKALSDGDTIRVGDSEVLFSLEKHKPETAGGFNISSPPPHSEMKTIHLDQAALDTEFGNAVGRMARDLAALLMISNATVSTRDIGQLQREILRLIFEVIPADDGAIVLLTPSDDLATSICRWSRKTGEKSSLTVEEEIVRRVFWERSAAITHAGRQTDGGRHVLCVPLVAVHRTVGVVYLASTEDASPFLDDHVHFLVSVSRIAAVALENIQALDALSAENRQLKEQIFSTTLVGESRLIRKLETFIARVADEDVTVLIRGESGTGKELVARSVHQNGARADRPFVAINCAAIPEALLESELFGHEKGSFTGAIATKKGKLEAAEEGTLFLDEIGELAPLLQAKLLRALQQREFERLGGTRTLKFSARVVAATNKDLEKAIKTGEFRQDLYYRLNVVSVTVPPLRDRRDDIPLLALYFANKYASKRKRPFKGISPQARMSLMNYDWPGNVRELENAIEHAIVLGVADEILLEDLPAALLEEQGDGVEGSRYHSAINTTKKELILEALRNSSGSFPEAAKSLGIHPKYLFRLVRNLKLRTDLT
jgi:transcriptional regulator with GAF, ATPase, and Fis domain